MRGLGWWGPCVSVRLLVSGWGFCRKVTPLAWSVRARARRAAAWAASRHACAQQTGWRVGERTRARGAPAARARARARRLHQIANHLRSARAAGGSDPPPAATQPRRATARWPAPAQRCRGRVALPRARPTRNRGRFVPAHNGGRLRLRAHLPRWAHNKDFQRVQCQISIKQEYALFRGYSSRPAQWRGGPAAVFAARRGAVEARGSSRRARPRLVRAGELEALSKLGTGPGQTRPRARSEGGQVGSGGARASALQKQRCRLGVGPLGSPRPGRAARARALPLFDAASPLPAQPARVGPALGRGGGVRAQLV